jgi:hypothetical protein
MKRRKTTLTRRRIALFAQKGEAGASQKSMPVEVDRLKRLSSDDSNRERVMRRVLSVVRNVAEIGVFIAAAAAMAVGLLGLK